MIIACIVLVSVLVIFVLSTFLMTYKNYKFEIEGGELRVNSSGSHLKIYFNNNLLQDVFSPQLFKGETVNISIKEKELQVFCKCNYLGNKLKVEVLEGDKIVATNGIEIKEKSK